MASKKITTNNAATTPTSFKTINGVSILGSGNIIVTGTTGSGSNLLDGNNKILDTYLPLTDIAPLFLSFLQSLPGYVSDGSKVLSDQLNWITTAGETFPTQAVINFPALSNK